MNEILECDVCGKSLLPHEVCFLERDEQDLMLCADCYDDETACPCRCQGDDSKCVYRERGATRREEARA